jgi:hypothetical protein
MNPTVILMEVAKRLQPDRERMLANRVNWSTYKRNLDDP